MKYIGTITIDVATVIIIIIMPARLERFPKHLII